MLHYMAKYDADSLRKAAAGARSVYDVIRILGGNPGSGGTYQHVRRKLTEHGIDTSHFVGLSANRGKRPTNKRTAAQVLAFNPARRTREKADRLRAALLETGRFPACAGCGLTEWQGSVIVFQVDHVNGNWRDNRSDNLQLLCPNCHSQKTLGAVAQLVERRLAKAKVAGSNPVIRSCGPVAETGIASDS